MAESFAIGNWGVSSEDILKTQFPLHRACRDGDVEGLAMLLSEGKHHMYQEDSFYCWTPAHWAAYFGKLSCIMWLLEKGVHPDKVTKKLRQSALHLAAFAGSSHCCKWLLHQGAKLDMQLGCLRRLLTGNAVNSSVQTSRFKQTPAHLAAFGGHPHCLLWLVQCGTQIELQDYLGETAIHKAARTGSLECVSLLAAQGANLIVINNNGHSCAQIADMCGHFACAKILDDYATQQRAQGVCNIANGLHKSNVKPVSHDVTTGAVIPCVPIQSNGLSHHNGFTNGPGGDAIEEVDMECSDNSGLSNPTVRQYATDITLDHGVSRNILTVGGRKRSREELHEVDHKRPRINEVIMEREVMEENSFMSPSFSDKPNMQAGDPGKVKFADISLKAQDDYVGYDYNGITEEDLRKASESYQAKYAQKPSRCTAYNLLGHYI